MEKNMHYLSVNEIVITNLTSEQKAEIEDMLDSEDPFDAVVPMPAEVSGNYEQESQWKECNWGTEGISYDCCGFATESNFGEKSDPSTVIFRCDTFNYAPSGIVCSLSRRYPDATCILRTTTDNEPADGGEETVYRNGRLVKEKRYSFRNKKAFYDFLYNLYGCPDFSFSKD